VFGNTGDSIRVFPTQDQQGELDDIITPADNECIADYLLEQIRQFTENPDYRLIVSIAGGRKTMSLLGGLTLSLLGRRQDRLCHVLVPEPFDSPILSPRFYYPDPSISFYEMPDKTQVPAADARIYLADIPFVPMRYLFQRDFATPAGTYMSLVRSLNAQMEKEIWEPGIKLELKSKTCEINGREVKFNSLEYIVFYYLALRQFNGEPAVIEVKNLYRHITDFLEKLDEVEFLWLEQCRSMFRGKIPDDMRKITSAIKSKIAKATTKRLAEKCAPGDTKNPGRYSLRVPPDNIELK
jgi:hypothetical protein